MLAERMENNRKNRVQIRRGDVCLITFFLFLALGSFVWFAMSRKDGRTLRISHDGQTIASMSLAQEGPRDMETAHSETARYCLILYDEECISCKWYEAGGGLAPSVPEGVSYNLLAVSAESVSMDAADCRDQICVHHIPITGSGESIICLPHKLAVEIVGGTGGSYEADG